MLGLRTKRRTSAARKLRSFSIEPLEQRQLLAIDAWFDDGLLEVRAGQTEQLVLSTDAGYVKINGNDPSTGPLGVADVVKIHAEAAYDPALMDDQGILGGALPNLKYMQIDRAAPPLEAFLSKDMLDLALQIQDDAGALAFKSRLIDEHGLDEGADPNNLHWYDFADDLSGVLGTQIFESPTAMSSMAGGGEVSVLQPKKVWEDDGYIDFTVVHRGEYTDGFSVDYHTSPGSATPIDENYDPDAEDPQDYYPEGSEHDPLTWMDGDEGKSRTVRIFIENDAAIEGTQEFTFHISDLDNFNPEGDEGSSLGESQANGVILDDDIQVEESGDTPLDDECECECECGGGFMSTSSGDKMTGELNEGYHSHQAGGVEYGSMTNPHVTVRTQMKLPPAPEGQTLTSIVATLKVDTRDGGLEISSAPVYYTPVGLTTPGTHVRFVLPSADLSALSSGVYQWTVDVKLYYSGSGTPKETRLDGEIAVVNRTESPVGIGWDISDVPRLLLTSWGESLVKKGKSAHYVKSGSTTYDTAPGYQGVLTGDRLVGFVLRDPDGTRWEFNTLGWLTKRIDRVGNQTTYNYDTLGRITSIVDPFEGTRTYAYNEDADPYLDSITDHAGRKTLFTQDTLGRLTSIKSPDPDAPGSGQTESTITYGYSGTTARITSKTDAESRVTNFVYDDAGYISRIVHAADNSDIEYEPVMAQHAPGHDPVADGGAGTISDPMNLSPAETDVVGSITDENDNTTSFTLNELGQFKTITDANSNTTVYQRNSKGWVTQITLPDPDGSGPLGQATVLINYDTRGNVTSMRMPGQTAYRTWTYDATYSQVTSFTDELSHKTIYTVFPDNGNTTKIRQVVGLDDTQSSETDDVVTDLTYTTQGFVQTVTEPASDTTTRTTRYEYGVTGHPHLVTAIKYAYGTSDEVVVGYDYDHDTHNLEHYTDERGFITDYEYDNLDRLKKATAPAPDSSAPTVRPVTDYTYNKMNQLRTAISKQTASLSSTTEYTYNSRGFLDHVILPGPTTGTPVLNTTPTWDYSYDAVGNLRFVTDPLDHQTEYFYDAGNRQTDMYEPAATSGARPHTHFDYDKWDRLTKLTDPEGNETIYQYDSRANLWIETNELGDSRTYGHDSTGKLIGFIDRNGTGLHLGRFTEYGYDDLNRLTTETWWNSQSKTTLYNTITFGYDTASNLVSVESEDAFDSGKDSGYSYTYDILGRLDTATFNGPYSLPQIVLSPDYITDTALRNNLDISVGGSSDSTLTFDYDRLGRMKLATQQTGSGAQKLANFGYNLASQLTSVAMGVTTSGTVNTSAYDYDRLGRLTGITHDPTSLSSNITYGYGYDVASRLTSITSSHADAAATFGYDYRDQVTSADRAGTTNDESYTYDDAGNRDTVGGATWTTTANNQLTNDGIFVYDYDNEGNLKTKFRISTAFASDYATIYTWDHRNRLARVIEEDNTGWATKVVEYTYDAFDRRIAKVLDANGYGSGGFSSELYAYDGANVILDFADADGPGGTATPGISHRYLHGPLVDQVLAQENVSGGSVTGVVWMLSDNQGTVRDLVNNSGQHVEHIAYDSFGNIKEVTDGSGTPISGPSTRYTYTGREWDAAVDMYFYRARWYDAHTGRFASEDPIGFAGGDYNLGRYIGNSATNGADPSGLETFRDYLSSWTGGFFPDQAEYDAMFQPGVPIGGTPPNLYSLVDGFLAGLRRMGYGEEVDTCLNTIDPPPPEGFVLAAAPPLLPTGRLAAGVGGKFRDAASQVQLRRLSLNSGTNQLKKAGLTRVRQTDGSYDFFDAAGQARARWVPRSGQQPAHWSKFEPSGNQKHYLDNAGRPVTGSDPSHRLPCR